MGRNMTIQTELKTGVDPNHQRRMAFDFLADEEDTTTTQAPTTLRSIPDRPPEGLRRVETSSVPSTTPCPPTLPPLRPLPASSAAPRTSTAAHLLFLVYCRLMSMDWLNWSIVSADNDNQRARILLEKFRGCTFFFWLFIRLWRSIK